MAVEGRPGLDVRGKGCRWGGREIKAADHVMVSLPNKNFALECLLPAAIAPSSSDIGGSSGDLTSPSGRESIHRPTTAKGSGGRHRLLMFL